MMQVVEIPLGPNGVAGYAIDVEDQEQARADLNRFVRAQRDMLDRLSAGVAQFGRDRSLIFFNQPFARLFSLTAEFLADRPEFDRRDRRDARGRQSARGARLPGLEGGAPRLVHQRPRRRRGGLAAARRQASAGRRPAAARRRPAARSSRTAPSRSSSPRRATPCCRVRTATFDNLFEAVGVFASDGRLNLWNNRFKELWGFDEEQLASHPRVDALAPHLSAKLKRASHAGLVRELVRSATVERKQRSGRVTMLDGREFEFAAVPLPDGNALFTMLDISDSRKVEAALRDRNEALEEADRLKTAFVSNMSYELRTPLTSIAGFAEMLAAGYAGELPPMATEYVAAILDSVVAARRADRQCARPHPERHRQPAARRGGGRPRRPVRRARRVGARSWPSARASSSRSRSKPSVGIVTGDRRRLSQAVGNVLSNALLYTDAGGRVLLRAEGGRDAARIIVSDNGRGIAAGRPGAGVRPLPAHRRRARRGAAGDRPRPAARPPVRRGAWRHHPAPVAGRARGRPSPSACRAPPSSAPIMPRRASPNRG